MVDIKKRDFLSLFMAKKMVKINILRKTRLKFFLVKNHGKILLKVNPRCLHHMKYLLLQNFRKV